MEKGLTVVLEDIKKKVDKIYAGKAKDKYDRRIEELLSEYAALEIPEKHIDIYNSLINRGKELQKESNIKNTKKLDFFLRYCGAAQYDFRDNMAPLNLIMKSFLLTCVLFFVLAPQYFSFILPLIFVIPIFMGLRGIKKRMMNGLMMGVSVVPMGLLVSIIWLRNAYLTLGNFDVFVSGLAQQYHFSLEFTRNLAVACIMMSAVMFGSSIVLLVSAIKHRKMFI